MSRWVNSLEDRVIEKKNLDSQEVSFYSRVMAIVNEKNELIAYPWI